MQAFASVSSTSRAIALAPDGSALRKLLSLSGGSMAHFQLDAGVTARAVMHRSVEELWFVVSGRGEMWRRQGAREAVVALEPGLCLSIPAGTHFQFRASAFESVTVVAVTMPPWPGDDEALLIPGPWQPTAG